MKKKTRRTQDWVAYCQYFAGGTSSVQVGSPSRRDIACSSIPTSVLGSVGGAAGAAEADPWGSAATAPSGCPPAASPPGGRAAKGEPALCAAACCRGFGFGFGFGTSPDRATAGTCVPPAEGGGSDSAQPANRSAISRKLSATLRNGRLRRRGRTRRSPGTHSRTGKTVVRRIRSAAGFRSIAIYRSRASRRTGRGGRFHLCCIHPMTK